MNVTARSVTAKLALNLDGVTPPSPPSPECKSFKDDIESLLSTQRHQFSAPEQQRVLDQLSEKIRNMPSDMITERDRAAGASAFITQLKQDKLNELDKDLGEYALRQAGNNVSMAITEMQTALAQKRLPALKLCRDAVMGDKHLLTCLDEHIAAAEKKSKNRDAIRIIKQLPDIQKALKEKRNEFRSRLKETVTTVENDAKTLLEEMVRAAIEDNNAKIAFNSEQKSKVTDKHIRAIDLRDMAMAITHNDKEELDKVEKAITHNETTLPRTLRSSLREFFSTQEGVLAVGVKIQELEEQTNNLIAPKDSPELKIIINRIGEEKQAMAGERTASQNAARAASNGSVMGDFWLRCKRLFGAGKGEKTRSEYRIVQRQHETAWKKHEQRIDALQGSHTQKLAALNESYTKEAQPKNSQLNDLRQKVVTLQATKAQQQSALLDEIKTELIKRLDAPTEQKNKEINGIYDALRLKLIAQQQPFVDALNALGEENKKLRGMLITWKLFSNMDILQQRFKGQPALARFEECHAQYQDIKASRHELHKQIESLDQLYDTPRLLEIDMSSGRKDDWRDEAMSIHTRLNQFGIDLKDCFSDKQSSLTDAANLYAMLCVEKVNDSPFLQEIRKAESVSDETLKSLSSLESMMDTPGWIPQSDNNQYRPGESPTEIMENIKNTISGLKKIIGNDLNVALVSKADFTAQLYHPENNIYIDRQGQHGTCVMHSWNNLLSFVTDNQKMMLTPWRMEKLIQSLIVQEANVKLKDILTASPRPPLSVIDKSLKQMIDPSNLCNTKGYHHLIKHGYMMEHEDDRYLIIKSNSIFVSSPRIFNLLNIRNENITLVIKKDTNADKRRDVLNTLQDKNFDAISIGFSFVDLAKKPNEKAAGHALALLKQGDDYLLVDSNYEDPIPMTLSLLVDFFCTDHAPPTLPESINRHPVSGDVTNLMRERGYNKYNTLELDFGLYKDKKT